RAAAYSGFRSNHDRRGPAREGRPVRREWCAVLLVVVVLASANVVGAAPEDEVRAVIDRYVTAQNTHDLAAVAELLWDSPRFLMNQVLLKTPAGWKVASILPIPAPAQ